MGLDIPIKQPLDGVALGLIVLLWILLTSGGSWIAFTHSILATDFHGSETYHDQKVAEATE